MISEKCPLATLPCNFYKIVDAYFGAILNKTCYLVQICTILLEAQMV
jgi:hypothetical protein